MTQFDITYTDFKREDTTNDITIKLYADNKRPITPDASHTWKAKVARGDKYVGEYPVTIFGNTIKLSSSNLTRLPDGIYALELWETYDGSTAIYPSTGTMEFRVHENIDDTLGTIDPTTDINAIIEDLHKAGKNIKVVATNTLPAGSKASVTQSITNGENQLTFYIPQGPKGEQGDVGPAPTLKIGTVTKLDPDQAPTVALTGGDGTYTLNMGIPQGVQGETNETATNALKLANSANDKLNSLVTSGRNYIQNSESIIMTPNGTDNYDLSWDVYSDAFASNAYCHGNDKTRLSFYLTPSKALPTARTFRIYWREEPWTPFGDITVPANTTDTQYYELAITTPTSQPIFSQIFIRFMADSTSDISYTITHSMLTIGDSFPDWQPAPEDAPSNDSQLVHKTNNETIAGDKTFVGNTTLATTTILEGNYGLRVTSSGIQKTTDGKTWVPANI